MTDLAIGFEAYTELESRRRDRRLEDWNIIDALYKAYMTALVGGISVLAVSGWVSGDDLTPQQLDAVASRGPGTIGLVFAGLAWAGIRSGRRGGPLSVEPALVRTILLSPLDRAQVLRPAATRQLRFGLFAGVVAGAVFGTFAFRRMPGAPVAWLATASLFGAAAGALAVGSALVVAGRRLPAPAALVGVAVLAAASVADVARRAADSPLSMAGRLALSPLRGAEMAAISPAELLLGAVVAIAALAVVPAAGVLGIGGVSIEAAERRSRLVALLRFAVTMRDLRAVILFRRALGQEQARTRPWLRVRSTRHFPIWHRDLQGVMRWPVPRLLRLAALGGVTGAAVAFALEGPSELAAVAALCLFVAATEATEGLAQEVDHPTLRAGLPVGDRDLWVRHLAVPAGVMVGVGIVAVVVAAALVGPAAFAGVVVVVPGAIVSVAVAGWVAVREPPEPTLELIDPTGIKVIYDLATPPAVAGSAALAIVSLHRVAPQLDTWAAVRVAASIEAFLAVGAVGWLWMPHPKGGLLASLTDVGPSARR